MIFNNMTDSVAGTGYGMKHTEAKFSLWQKKMTNL